MSKRFILLGFAALLALSFSAIALAADVPSGGLVSVDRASLVEHRNATSPHLATSDAQALTLSQRNTLQNEMSLSLPDAGCQELTNTCQSPAFIWSLPSSASGDRVAISEGYLPDPGAQATPCTVKTVYVWIYDWVGYDSTGTIPVTADVDVSIYGDDGAGLPGALIQTVTLPAATVDADIVGGAYSVVDFTPYNIVIPAGEAFHVVFEVPGAVAGEGIFLVSDPGGEDAANCPEGANNPLGSMYYTSVGAWASQFDLFGISYGFEVYADVCCEPIPPDCFTLTNTCQSPAFIWSLPSSATGDRVGISEGYTLDPTGTRECTLKTVYVWIYDWVGYDSTGTIPVTADVQVDVHADDGSGLPGAVLATVVIPAATVDADIIGGAYTVVDLSSYNLTAAGGDNLHVAFSVPGAVAGEGIFLVSDPGGEDAANCPEGANNPLGSMYYTSVGAWASQFDLFGISYGFEVYADVCCPPLLFALCTPGADADWTTGGNDFGRTYSSDADISNLCALNQAWTATAGGAIAVEGPVIADGHVLVSSFNQLECYDQASGALQWTFGGFPYIGDDLRCQPTVDVANQRVYVGGAAFKAFTCVDLGTGAVIWSRNSGGGGDVPLTASPGLTRFAPSVLVGGTVITVDEAGNVYFLDAATGADVLPPTLLPDAIDGSVPYNALASDGASKIWVGTANSVFSDGWMYQLDATTGAIDWAMEDPSAIFSGDPVVYGDEGFPNSFAYEGGILYYFGHVRQASLDNFPNSGSVGAIDVAVEDGTGAGILWVYSGTMAGATLTGPLMGGPALGPGMVYVHARGYFSSDPDGIHAFDKVLGTEIWFRDYYSVGTTVSGDQQADVRGYVPVSVFCHADQTPYLFAGDFSGRWRLINGNTGQQVWERTFNGIVLGTALADDYAVVACRTAAEGTLTAFTVGADRPRLQIDSQFVLRTATPGDGATAGDIVDAFQNTGCLDLNVAGYAATSPAAARISSVNPLLRASATRVVDSKTAGYDGFITALSDKQVAMAKRDIDREVVDNNIRTFANNASAAADPIFLTINTAGGAVSPGASQTLNVTWDETGLMNNTLYTNYIEIDSDDPDYYPEDPSGATFGLPAIQFQLFIGCPDDDAYITLGLGEEWITNHGRTSDGDGNGFHINGEDNHFDGSMCAAAGDNAHWAIEGISVTSFFAAEWGPTLPCGVNVGSGTYGSDVVDTVSYNMIDLASSEGWFPVGSRQMGGILLNIQHVGPNDPAFGDFSLARVTVTNEADGNGDLTDFYFGLETDWDVDPYSANNGVRFPFGYAVDNAGAGSRGAATRAYGHARLDGDVVGSAFLQSGGSSGSFMMGDFWGYPGTDLDSNTAFNEMSDPDNYVATFYPGVTVGNDDIGALVSMMHVPTLAEGASETMYYCTYGLNNGTNGLPWADDAGFDAAVNEIVCRAKAFAGFAKGDANCDGVVDLADVVLIGNIVDGLYDPTGTGGAYSGDANGDGTIDGLDYDLVYDVVAGVQPASAMANGWRF